MGLVIGGAVTLVFTFIYYMMRDVLSFEEFAKCIPEGPVHDRADSDPYDGVDIIRYDKPARCKIFRGRSCGKLRICDAGISANDHFPGCCVSGICNRNILGNIQHSDPDRDRVFPEGQMMVISIASCLAGAVCGDHCSPISDTTIMASAGGHCEHVNHVVTQLPYVLVVGSVCMVGYLLIGIFKAVGLDAIVWLTLPICIVLLCVVLFVIRTKNGGKEEI